MPRLRGRSSNTLCLCLRLAGPSAQARFTSIYYDRLINFAGSPAVAAGLSDLVVHGFPDDHFDRLRAQIEATTAEQVTAAARDRLRPDDLVTVVVGDASVVAESLGEIGLGSVEVVTDED